MKGCLSCKTTYTAVVGGRTVCYYCGQSQIDNYSIDIPIEELGGETITDVVDDSEYGYSDYGLAYD